MKTFKVWNMTTGEEYERQAESIEDFIEDTPHHRSEQLESHYDAILEKWFFYIRQKRTGYINPFEERHEIQIMQISLKE